MSRYPERLHSSGIILLPRTPVTVRALNFRRHRPNTSWMMTVLALLTATLFPINSQLHVG